jgi:acetate kinase
VETTTTHGRPAAILAVNSGSSSLKCALFSDTADMTPLTRHLFDGLPSEPEFAEWLDARSVDVRIAAVGHRLVHGGPDRERPQLISRAVLDELQDLVRLAPNHLPAAIALIKAIGQRWPGVPQVACFDTAFHSSMPAVARRLPIPRAFDAAGVRRYGFHGLSYTYLLERLESVAGSEAARGRVVFAHLGNGSSLAAVSGGRSIDTTMAFTPIGGVVMSTRSGDLDPGVVTHIGRVGHLNHDQVETVLSRESGMIGVSGWSGDMRALLEREATDAASRLAVEICVYSIAKAVGALAVALRGLDTLVFSGGIGEHSAAVRARICSFLTFLGVDLDPELNQSNSERISSPASRVVTWVMPTDEEAVIARAVRHVLSPS